MFRFLKILKFVQFDWIVQFVQFVQHGRKNALAVILVSSYSCKICGFIESYLNLLTLFFISIYIIKFTWLSCISCYLFSYNKICRLWIHLRSSSMNAIASSFHKKKKKTCSLPLQAKERKGNQHQAPQIWISQKGCGAHLTMYSTFLLFPVLTYSQLRN